MPVQSVFSHNPPAYQVTLSHLLRSPYIKKNVVIADKTEAKKQGGEYTKKLQSLMKMSEIYNKIIPRLHGYSVSQMREADGIYPKVTITSYCCHHRCPLSHCHCQHFHLF